MPRSARDQNIFEVGIETAWELDLFGRVRHSVEAAGGLAGAAEADLAQVRLLVVAETARAYTELATAQAAIPLQKRALAAAQESLRILRDQVGEGKAPGDKIGPADAAVTAAQHLLRDLSISERAARNRLAVLGGGGKIQTFNAPTIPVIPAPALPSDASRLLAHRPDVQAAERRLAAGRAIVGVAAAEYFPTVTLVGRIGAETNQPGNLGSADANTFAFGPRLQWDLLNLHRTMSRVDGAKAQSRQAFAAWEDSVLLALEELDNALALRAASLAKFQEWGRTTAAMEESARVARLRAEEGRIDPGEALAVEQGALQAQLARLRSEAGLANATIFLQKTCAFDR
jgi:outer membrane protein TolC